MSPVGSSYLNRGHRARMKPRWLQHSQVQRGCLLLRADLQHGAISDLVAGGCKSLALAELMQLQTADPASCLQERRS